MKSESEETREITGLSKELMKVLKNYEGDDYSCEKWMNTMMALAMTLAIGIMAKTEDNEQRKNHLAVFVDLVTSFPGFTGDEENVD